MDQILYVSIGIVAGLISGAFGVGGGIFLVPFFVLAMGLDQKTAQGTALAIMLPPITLLAVLRYYYAGHVKFDLALLVCLGFLAGSFFSAHLVQALSNHTVRKGFAFLLLGVAIKMFTMK